MVYYRHHPSVSTSRLFNQPQTIPISGSYNKRQATVLLMTRPVGSNYRLGGGGGGGAHITDWGGGTHKFFSFFFFIFFFFFFFGGGHICANYWGGTAPRAPPLFLRP